MKVRGTVWRVGLSSCAALALLGCSPDEIVVGERCPHPSSGRATIAGGQMSSDGYYGTSCAPCDTPPELDKNGCPVYVTFESCGGNICVGTVELEPASDDDAGTGDAAAADAATDGGADAGDAGMPEEDAGAN